MKPSPSRCIVLRFVKMLIFGLSGLFALGSAMALILGSSAPGTPVNRTPAFPLLLVGVGLSAGGVYELLHGIQELVNTLIASGKPENKLANAQDSMSRQERQAPDGNLVPVADAGDCGAFDAEVALLALGPNLLWNKSRIRASRPHLDTDMEWAATSTGHYYVELELRYQRVPQQAAKFVSPRDPADYYPYPLENRATAKAACERHHMTGKWE